MAHFLEHMIFMGSEKYPDENSFHEFVQKHGGSHNAQTDCEQTIFYFDIQRKNFEECLDRFAQFFIAPLMKKDAMERERKAVHSEYEQNVLTSDGVRRELIVGSLAKDKHPMTKFMWGNLTSLQMSQLDDQEVHKRLNEFFHRHYTAQSMTAVIQSQETLEKLEGFVLKSFSDIPNNQQNKEVFIT